MEVVEKLGLVDVPVFDSGKIKNRRETLMAKGNPVGQGLMILFSVLYGIISWRVAYYGEMITYLGMTAPMAALR